MRYLIGATRTRTLTGRSSGTGRTSSVDPVGTIHAVGKDRQPLCRTTQPIVAVIGKDFLRAMGAFDRCAICAVEARRDVRVGSTRQSS